MGNTDAYLLSVENTVRFTRFMLFQLKSLRIKTLMDNQLLQYGNHICGAFRFLALTKYTFSGYQNTS